MAKRKKKIRKMRTTREIVTYLRTNDPDTVIRKANLRKLFKTGKAYAFEQGGRRWIADIDEVLACYGNPQISKIESVPRVRTYEDSVQKIKQDFAATITTKEITDILHGGKVKVLYHGNKWILNYDELKAEVKEYLAQKMKLRGKKHGNRTKKRH